MKINKVINLLKTKKKTITLLIVIAVAWILGQLLVPFLLKVIFL